LNLKFLTIKDNFLNKKEPIITYRTKIQIANLKIKSTHGSYLKFSSRNFYFIIDKIQSMFLRIGKKNNLIKNFSKSIFYFYYYFMSSNMNLILDKNIVNFNRNDYLYISEFKTQLFQKDNYLNIQNIFYMFLNDLQPFFFLKCSLIEKKFRKKKEEKYLYKISYIKKNNRVKKSLNIFRLGFFRTKKYKYI